MSELLNGICNNRWHVIFLAPLNKSSDTLRENYFLFSMITVPKFGSGLIKDIFVPFFSPIANFNEDM
jgi:hypothetical protein